jgi:hypothetical protein
MGARAISNHQKPDFFNIFVVSVALQFLCLELDPICRK